ncbi:MAG: TIGR01620 family protein [Pseudomonadota bacterium]
MKDTPQGPITLDAEELARLPEPKAPKAPELLDTPVVKAARVGRSVGRLARLGWGAFLSLVTLLIGVSMWDGLVSMFARSPVLGQLALALAAIAIFAVTLGVLRELAVLRRLQSATKTRERIASVLEEPTLADAKAISGEVVCLVRSRPESQWSLAQFEAAQAEIYDGDALLAYAERSLMGPLDAVAVREIQTATRRVATVTALIPMPLSDVLVALFTATSMIRRVAEAYGAGAGRLGAWRLFRMVVAHLVATGAVAVGDDLIGSVLGGGLVSKLSRRFGEGVINGALMARVGIAAMEVCRPMPFAAMPKPGVSSVVSGALTGVFSGRD